jgi:hypothetical protein
VRQREFTHAQIQFSNSQQRFDCRTVIASEAKQSILPLRREMDCFASLAMTVLHLNRRGSLKIESEAYSAFALQRCAAAPEIQTAATDRTIRRCSPA